MPNPEVSRALIPELAELLADSNSPEKENERDYSGLPPDADSWPMISFAHVSMWFGDRRILDNVSFTVDRGETLCILGRSGVGKSVALRILMGFLKP